MADTNSIEAALEEAVSGKAASAPAEPETTEVKPDTQVAEVTSTDEGKDEKGPVPYDRFAQVNSEKNTALSEIETLQKQIEEFEAKDKTVQSQLDELLKERDVLERVRDLANDDRYKDHVLAIDQALKGIEDIEDDLEDGEIDDEEAEAQIEDLLAEQREELDDVLATDRAERLLDQAHQVAGTMLDNLPDRYTDVDKEVISEMWTSRVDWDSIEDDSSELRPALVEGLKTTLEEYGPPRGELQHQLEEANTGSSGQTQTQSNEEVVQGLLDRDWSKVNVAEDGKVLGPEHSDTDFAAALAEQIRRTRT